MSGELFVTGGDTAKVRRQIIASTAPAVLLAAFVLLDLAFVVSATEGHRDCALVS